MHATEQDSSGHRQRAINSRSGGKKTKSANRMTPLRTWVSAYTTFKHFSSSACVKQFQSISFSIHFYFLSPIFKMRSHKHFTILQKIYTFKTKNLMVLCSNMHKTTPMTPPPPSRLQRTEWIFQNKGDCREFRLYRIKLTRGKTMAGNCKIKA